MENKITSSTLRSCIFWCVRPRFLGLIRSTMCCIQFLLTSLESGIVDLLSFGALGTSNGRDVTRTLRLAIKDLSNKLLPEAIGLTDAFGFTDWELDRLDPSIFIHILTPRYSNHQRPWCIWWQSLWATLETCSRWTTQSGRDTRCLWGMLPYSKGKPIHWWSNFTAIY